MFIKTGVINLFGVVLGIPQKVKEVFRLTNEVDIVMDSLVNSISEGR